MNRLLLALSFILGMLNGYAQETKTITKKTSRTVEQYEVLKSDKKIMDGNYTKKTIDGRLITKGKFKNNQESGIWEYYDYSTGELEQKFDYDNGNFIILKFENTTQNHFYYRGEWIMDKLDTVPIIIGGLSDLKLKLSESAYKSIKPPNFPKAGFALFSFIVTKNGETKDFKIAESSGNSFEEDLLKIIENSGGKWFPGKFKGENVDTEFFIPMNVRYKVDLPNEKVYRIEFNYPTIR